MIRTIDLVAPPLVCANGRRPWAPTGISSCAGSQKRKREGKVDGKDEGELGERSDPTGADMTRPMDSWEIQMLQMLVSQGLTESAGHEGAPALPPALAFQLCQMSYGALALFLFSCLPLLSLFSPAICDVPRTHIRLIAHTAIRRAHRIFRLLPTLLRDAE